jgi:hypothetical protein
VCYNKDNERGDKNLPYKIKKMKEVIRMTITATELRERVKAVEDRRAKERETNAVNWVDGLTSEMIGLADCGMKTNFTSVPTHIDLTIVKRTLEERGFEVRGSYSGLWIEW